MLAGIPVRDDEVLELARLVDDDALANKLEDAFGGWSRCSPSPSLSARRSKGL